jgi:hypothetical protein
MRDLYPHMAEDGNTQRGRRVLGFATDCTTHMVSAASSDRRVFRVRSHTIPQTTFKPGGEAQGLAAERL